MMLPSRQTLVRVVAALLVWLVAVAWSRPLVAQPSGPGKIPNSREVTQSDEERAATLKSRGDTAMLGLRYQEALDAYREAYSLTQDPALLYNQARAQQALGDFAAALELLERFDAEAKPAVKARLHRLQELLQELRGRVTQLSVRCNVEGARVILGDKVIGTTPLPAVIKTASGRTTLQVLDDVHRPYKKEIDLPGGGSFSLDIVLLRKDMTGIVVIESNVRGAHVSVDAKVVGDAPAEIVVPSGEHKIFVEAPGYEPARTSVVVHAGERRSVQVPLKKEASIFARWWFWTGVGVVVAGGVATYVVLTTPRDPDRGTISPGQVAAPLVRF